MFHILINDILLIIEFKSDKEWLKLTQNILLFQYNLILCAQKAEYHLRDLEKSTTLEVEERKERTHRQTHRQTETDSQGNIINGTLTMQSCPLWVYLMFI